MVNIDGGAIGNQGLLSTGDKSEEHYIGGMPWKCATVVNIDGSAIGNPGPLSMGGRLKNIIYIYIF